MKTNYLTKAIATIGLAGSLLCAQSTKADVVEELMGKSILAQDYNEDNSCLFNEEPLAEYFTGVSSRKYEMPKIMKAKISDGELGYDDANELVEYYNNEEAKELAMIQSERELISNSLDELTTQRVDEQSRIEEIDENLEKVPDKNYGSMKNFIDKKRDELEKKNRELVELNEIISILQASNKQGLDLVGSFEGERKRLQEKEESLRRKEDDLAVYENRVKKFAEKVGYNIKMIFK